MSRGRNILGLSHSHDSGVAWLSEGKLVAAVNGEGLSRQKYDGAFPAKSLAWVLNGAVLDPRDVDVVAVGGRHLASHPALNNNLSEEDGSYRARSHGVERPARTLREPARPPPTSATPIGSCGAPLAMPNLVQVLVHATIKHRAGRA